jgi:hydrophobic/amphiphilic exporter-1 (mainly G- bacteria), HAE1 family
VVFLSLIAIFFSSFLLLRFIGTDFLPESDESRINASVELTSGLRVEETIKVARELENMINRSIFLKQRYILSLPAPMMQAE